MTIDERLETLARSMELLTRLPVDTEKRHEERFAQYDRLFKDNEQRMEQVLDAINRQEQRMGQVLDAINRLANIAEAYQMRLDEHEERLDDPSHGS